MELKTFYTLGTECNFSDEEELYQFIEQHRIKEEDTFIAKYLSPILCFKQGTNGLVTVIEMEDDHLHQIEENLAIDYDKLSPPNRNVNLIQTANYPSKSWIGGKSPNKLTIQSTSTFSSVDFQYVAQIHKEEIGLKWLPFNNIHLVYPFAKGVIEPIFYKYIDENIIQLLGEPKVYEALSYSLAEQVVFTKQNIRLESINKTTNKYSLWDENFRLGLEGVPLWIQAPQFPTSPVNWKMMQFLCQLDRLEDWKFTNKQDEDKRAKFALNGSIYFFIEPESKVIAALKQNT